MKTGRQSASRFIWAVLVFVVLLIINIRVEAGLGTPFERAVDGLVGGVILLIAAFLALRFFQCDGDKCGNEKSCLQREL